jgi:2-aminoadipate transaminase
MRRSFIREILENINEDTISFAGGLPDENLFPKKKIEESYRAVMNDASYLQYGLSSGYEDLKIKIATQYTNNGLITSSDEILITSGSQQALDIIARYYKNTSISIEKPSYLGATNVFKLNNLSMESLEINNKSYNIEKFEDNIQKTKLAYLIPDFQNPTGFTYSDKMREEIALCIKNNNALLIEDSPYSDLYFEKKYRSISSYIPNNSFHLGSFSKVLAPGFRVGYIRANKELLKPLLAYKEAMDLHTNNISQYVLNEYLKHIDDFIHHKKVLRKVYKKKLQIFKTYLDEILPEFEYEKPKGGMFIYGKFKNIDTAILVQKCIKKGVVFVPGNEFYINSDEVTNEIRFNFTKTTAKEVYKGLHIIKSIIDKGV